MQNHRRSSRAEPFHTATRLNVESRALRSSLARRCLVTELIHSHSQAGHTADTDITNPLQNNLASRIPELPTKMQDARPSCCQREAQEFYNQWLSANDGVDNGQAKESRKDKNLNAFAQLAALKMRAQLAVVSLFDGKSQYILAQYTQDGPHSHDSSIAHHELPASQSQSDAFCDQHILAHLTTCPRQTDPPITDHFISLDCQSDDRFKDHALVKKEDGVRFAIGVPLVSRTNCIIGALVVLDGSPRGGEDNRDLSALKDYAQCVVRHLELVQSSSGSSREISVLRGISRCFGNQYRSLPEPEKDGKSEESSLGRDTNSHERTSTVKLETEDYADLATPKSMEASIQAAFDDVAKILRDCSLADGALILGPPAVESLMVADDSASPPGSDERDGDDPTSRLLSTCLDDRGLLSAGEGRQAPSVCSLRHLAYTYPRGAVFDIKGKSVHEQRSGMDDQSPSCPDPANDHNSGNVHGIVEVLTMLRNDILENDTEVQTMLFLPVYAHDNGKLLASCFAWICSGVDSSECRRDASDYHVIGNFLSHSIAQLRMQNKDAEQKKFMSNFSHELRTPINGILGSAQFLQDTVSDDYQNELLQSIVVSSNTLLDTASLLSLVLTYHLHPTLVTCAL
jgi:hypothetical protein